MSCAQENISKPKIISVSRRTDIPAFYGEWFLNRIKAGWCLQYNPYTHKTTKVSLEPDEVTVLVFWSKNFQPFLKYLTIIDNYGYNSYFLFTITGLPSLFEPKVICPEEAIKTFKILAQRYSPRHIQWRFDPILLTNYTDPKYYLCTFQKLCQRLEGYTFRCYTSIANIYPKVKRRLKKEVSKGIILLEDISIEEKKHLVNSLAEIAAAHGMEMHICCNDYLLGPLTKKAHCIDAEVLSDLFGIPKGLYKKAPTRKQCGCYESIDIGIYDTCPHSCLYCYANSNLNMVKYNYKRHNPSAPAMLPDLHAYLTPEEEALKKVPSQLSFKW